MSERAGKGSGGARAGQSLFIGVEGAELSADERRFIKRAQPGGFILFARNLQSPEQTQALLRSMQELLVEPCFFAIDQEGGRVDRLKQFMPPMPAMFKTALRGEEAVRRHAAVSAHSLAALGFNVNFAPVLDLFSPFRNAIEDRCFGCVPVDVAALGAAYLREIRRHGVSGTLKHFPGLGRGECDSHLELPVIPIKRAAFMKHDLLPFRKNVRNSPLAMVAHAFYPDFEKCDERPIPASLSRNIVTGLLRNELGFDGLALTDDLMMGALKGFGEVDEISELALLAGCDMLLICRGLENCEKAYRFLARRGPVALARHKAQSARRIRRVKSAMKLHRQVAAFSPEAFSRAFAETLEFTSWMAH
ncbi:MAG: beta-N-acetylhexosaminidase [Acidobacteriota bacterium]